MIVIADHFLAPSCFLWLLHHFRIDHYEDSLQNQVQLLSFDCSSICNLFIF